MRKEHLRQLLQTLRNPLVILSLSLGIIGAAPLWYSGIYIGRGQEQLAALLFGIYIVVFSFDALVTLTLLLGRK